MQRHFLLCAVALVAVYGCAGPEASTEPAPDKGEYVTGSNIPRRAGAPREHVEVANPADLQRANTGAVTATTGR